jgi:ABC-type phosphate transport system substrate-binding protein
VLSLRVVRRLAVPALALAIALPATFVTTTAPVGAEPARALTAEPATGLGTQVVRVSWSNFRPTASTGQYAVNLLQCKADPKDLEKDCYTPTPFPDPDNGNRVYGATTKPDGTGSAFIEVRASAQLPELDCSASNPCSILAYELTGRPLPDQGLPAESALAPLAFAKSVSDCPPVDKIDITAEGEASSAAVFYRWAADRCAGTDPLVLDYTETNSNSGRADFLNNQVDLGLTSLPATQDELDGAPQKPESFRYAPMDLTAIAVVFNMTDPKTQQRITDLTLSPRLLARVVSNTTLSEFFQDPELAKLNPGVRWPLAGLSPPLMRAEKNADTWLITSYLGNDAVARAFLSGSDPDGIEVSSPWKDVSYPADRFENRAGASDVGYVPRQGQNAVVTRVFYGVKPSESVNNRTDITGFIGFVDWPTAIRYGLPTAKIVNAAGNAVAPTPDSVLAGYLAMRRNADGTRVADLVSTVANAYPLTKIDYAMTMFPRGDDERSTKVKDFFAFAAGPGQESLDAGYVQLPDELRAQTQALAENRDPLVPLPPPDAPPVSDVTPPSGSFSDTGSGGGSSLGSGSNQNAVVTAAPPKAPEKQRDEPARVYTPIGAFGVGGERWWLPVVFLLAGLGAIGLGVSAVRRRVVAVLAARRSPS